MSDDDKIGIFLILKKIEDISPEIHVSADLNDAKKILSRSPVRKSKKNTIPSVSFNRTEETFDTIIDGFVESFIPYYKLSSIVPHIGGALARVQIREEIIEKRKDYHEIETKGSGGIYRLDSAQSKLVMKTLSDARDYAMAFKVVPGSVLMSVVATFDAHLAGLARFLLLKNRRQVESSSREIKIVDIFKFNSFDELLENIVYEEVYKIMWESHQKQVSRLEELFNVKIKEHFSRWGEFIEVFERRNLVAHGEGFATERYFQNCRQANLSSSSDRILAAGSGIDLSPQYIRKSTDFLLLFLMIFAFVIRTKQDPNDFDVAYEKMNDLAFRLLKIGRHSLASELLEVMVDWRWEGKDEEVHRMMIINLANAQKFCEANDASMKTLNRYQWKASSDKFRICEAAVRADTDEVCRLLPKIKNDDSIGADDFRQWPVFNWIKDDQKFHSEFKKVFDQEFISST